MPSQIRLSIHTSPVIRTVPGSPSESPSNCRPTVRPSGRRVTATRRALSPAAAVASNRNRAFGATAVPVTSSRTVRPSITTSYPPRTSGAVRSTSTWARPCTQHSNHVVPSPKTGPSVTSKFAHRPGRSDPTASSTPASRAGTSVNASSAARSDSPCRMASRTAPRRSSGFASPAAVSANGTPAASSRAGFSGANSQCFNSSSPIRRARYGSDTSNAAGKFSCTTHGTPAAFTSAIRW